MEFVVGMKIMSKLNVLYEDNHIIVVIKPPNVPSQSDISGDKDMLTMVKEYVKVKYNKPGNVYIGLVHRLDRPVSGIMVFARSSKAASRLTEQIKTHVFKKTYLAIVNGLLDVKEGTLVNYIVKQNDNSSKITVKGKGKLAKLSYTVLEENKSKKISLVKINLETGRHHQIRVQFANIGHPLYGDQRYGKQDKNQIALYATKLEFVHPVKKEPMIFEHNPPNIFPWEVFKSVK